MSTSDIGQIAFAKPKNPSFQMVTTRLHHLLLHLRLMNLHHHFLNWTQGGEDEEEIVEENADPRLEASPVAP